MYHISYTMSFLFFSWGYWGVSEYKTGWISVKRNHRILNWNLLNGRKFILKLFEIGRNKMLSWSSYDALWTEKEEHFKQWKINKAWENPMNWFMQNQKKIYPNKLKKEKEISKHFSQWCSRFLLAWAKWQYRANCTWWYVWNNQRQPCEFMHLYNKRPIQNLGRYMAKKYPRLVHLHSKIKRKLKSRMKQNQNEREKKRIVKNRK